MGITLVTYVESYLTISEFPPTGNLDTIYIDRTNRALYIWNGASYELAGTGIIAGIVNTYNDLPSAINHNGEIWLVTTDVPPNDAGLYVSNGLIWTYIPAGGAIDSIQGTANQVLVNGTSGTPQTGNIILTTPQNIAPESSPTFAGLTLAGLNGVLKASSGVISGSATPSDIGAPNVTIIGENFSSINSTTQVLTNNPVNVSGSNITGILKAASFPALTGDITTPVGSLATTITAASVTYAKIQNISTNNILLGRYTASAGPTQEITIGSGLSLSGAGLLTATGTGGTVTTISVTANNGITQSITNPTTTPVITLGLGAITPTSVNASGSLMGSTLTLNNGGSGLTSTNSGINFSAAFTEGNYINYGGGGRNVGIFTGGAFFRTFNLDYSVTSHNYIYNSTNPGFSIEIGSGGGSLRHTPSGTIGTSATMTSDLTWNSSGIVAVNTVLAMNTNKTSTLRMNDSDIQFRSTPSAVDANHGVGWYGSGKTFASAAPDGAVLYGNLGGILGSILGGQKIALTWNNSQQINIPGLIASQFVLTDGSQNLSSQSTAAVKTLLNLANTNSGDVTIAGENYLSLAAQVLTANAVNLATTNVSGLLPISKGGNNIGSQTTNGILYNNGTANVTSSSLTYSTNVALTGGAFSQADFTPLANVDKFLLLGSSFAAKITHSINYGFSFYAGAIISVGGAANTGKYNWQTVNAAGTSFQTIMTLSNTGNLNTIGTITGGVITGSSLTINNGNAALTGFGVLNFASTLTDGNYINLGVGGRNIGVLTTGAIFSCYNLDQDGLGNYLYNVGSAYANTLEIGPSGFALKYSAGGTAGSAATLTTGLIMGTSGFIGINTTTLSYPINANIASSTEVGSLFFGDVAGSNAAFNIGMYFSPQMAPTSATTTLTATTYILPNVSIATGKTITSQRALYIDAGTKSGTGTITNAYGLYVEAPTYGTTNYSALFAGNVNFAGSITANNLSYDGAATVTLSSAAVLNSFMISSTASSGASEGAIYVKRGHGGTGAYAQIHYSTTTSEKWATGLRQNDDNLHFYDAVNSIDRMIITQAGVINIPQLGTTATLLAVDSSSNLTTSISALTPTFAAQILSSGAAGSITNILKLQSPRSFSASANDGVLIIGTASNGTLGTHDYGAILMGNNPATNNGGAGLFELRAGGSASNSSSNGVFLRALTTASGSVTNVSILTGSAVTAIGINSTGVINIPQLGVSAGLVAIDSSSNLTISTSTLSPTFASETLSSGSAGAFTTLLTLKSPRTTTSATAEGNLIVSTPSNGTLGLNDFGAIFFGHNQAVTDDGAGRVEMRVGGTASNSSSNGIFFRGLSTAGNAVSDLSWFVGGTQALQVDNTLNTNVLAGNLQIATVGKGLNIKSVAVSAGVANGAFVTGVVLIAGTVTISNSFVTANCTACTARTTNGGTTGAYSVECGAGTFTVKSTSLIDTSTLNISFTKGF